MMFCMCMCMILVLLVRMLMMLWMMAMRLMSGHVGEDVDDVDGDVGDPACRHSFHSLGLSRTAAASNCLLYSEPPALLGQTQPSLNQL